MTQTVIFFVQLIISSIKLIGFNCPWVKKKQKTHYICDVRPRKSANSHLLQPGTIKYLAILPGGWGQLNSFQYLFVIIHSFPGSHTTCNQEVFRCTCLQFYIVFLLAAFLLFTIGPPFVLVEWVSIACSSCAVRSADTAGRAIIWPTFAPFFKI